MKFGKEGFLLIAEKQPATLQGSRTKHWKDCLNLLWLVFSSKQYWQPYKGSVLCTQCIQGSCRIKVHTYKYINTNTQANNIENHERGLWCFHNAYKVLVAEILLLKSFEPRQSSLLFKTKFKQQCKG